MKNFLKNVALNTFKYFSVVMVVLFAILFAPFMLFFTYMVAGVLLAKEVLQEALDEL